MEDEIIIKDEKGEIKVLTSRDLRDLDHSSQLLQKEENKEKESLVFDENDKIEIDGIKKAMPQKTFKAINYGQAIDEIIKAGQIKFEDEVTKNKFGNLVLARLKDVRDKVETRTTLMRKKENGGMGLDDAVAEKVLAIIEKKFQEIMDISHKEVGQTVENEIFKKKYTAPQNKKPNLVFSSKLPAEQVKVKQVKKLQSTIVTPKSQTKKEIAMPIKQKPVQVVTPPVKSELPKEQTKDKKKIKYSTKLTGPLEELSGMNLTDFKRLAQNPREATRKIYEKIKLLEKESFTHKLKAIKAWQKSPLNQLYLDVGHECLQQEGIDLEEIIAQRKNQNKTYLSSEEFKAIMDFNKKLRY